MNSSVEFKVRRLRPQARLPFRATSGSSGFDLYSCLDTGQTVDLSPEPQLVPTGIAIELPAGFDATIRPRSGLGARGVNVVFGTIDSDYRGELFVTMYVFGQRSSYQVSHGDRIAQLVISRLAEVELSEVKELSSSDRGIGGHGSTGA